jgi:hypothetical protein
MVVLDRMGTRSRPWEEGGWHGEVAPAAPVVSSLAVRTRPLKPGRARTLPVFGVCVHTTGSGPAAKSRQRGRPAIEVALDVYYGQPEDPHYVIDYNGTIHAVVPENRVAWHAGWGGAGKGRWASWTAPAWWSGVWRRWKAATPADLLPPGARDPNQVYIGVELLGNEQATGFTPAQYDALARLVVDVTRRHGITIPAAPSPRLLGHEDVEPIRRSNRFGGWDPGAHRTKPVFSWAGLWSRMQAVGAGTGPPAGAPRAPAGAPRAPAGPAGPAGPAAAPGAPPAGGPGGAPAASQFRRSAPNPRRYRLLATLLDRYRGDIPLEFLLGWIAVESGGFIDVVTHLDERGFFQVMKSESEMLHFDHARLSTDPDYSVQAGIRLVRFYADLVRRRYPWFTPGSELFWRVVKLQHAMGGGTASALLSSMRKRNLPMTWEAIKRYEVTDGPRLHRLLQPRDPSQRGRFGRNVDKVFVTGRQLAASLGR